MGVVGVDGVTLLPALCVPRRRVPPCPASVVAGTDGDPGPERWTLPPRPYCAVSSTGMDWRGELTPRRVRTEEGALLDGRRARGRGLEQGRGGTRGYSWVTTESGLRVTSVQITVRTKPSSMYPIPPCQHLSSSRGPKTPRRLSLWVPTTTVTLVSGRGVRKGPSGGEWVGPGGRGKGVRPTLPGHVPGVYSWVRGRPRHRKSVLSTLRRLGTNPTLRPRVRAHHHVAGEVGVGGPGKSDHHSTYSSWRRTGSVRTSNPTPEDPSPLPRVPSPLGVCSDRPCSDSSSGPECHRLRPDPGPGPPARRESTTPSTPPRPATGPPCRPSTRHRPS